MAEAGSRIPPPARRSEPIATAAAVPPVTAHTFKAPQGGVVEGRGYWLNRHLAIAAQTVATGNRFYALTGVVEFAKGHEEVWAADDVLFWHAGGGCLTNVVLDESLRVGVADRAAVRPSVTGFVRLDTFQGEGEPIVTGCTPSTAVCGGADFTLHVVGSGFTPSTVILFNGGEEPTTYVSASELTTGVKPSLVLAPVVVPVSVVGADTSADFTFTAAP